MGTFAAGLPSLERVDLLPYHRIGRDKYQRLGKVCAMPETDPPSEAWLATIAEMLRGFRLPVSLNG
jgi:pyruvate formate lyase activating enzyme